MCAQQRFRSACKFVQSQGYKTFFMLNSTEHELFSAYLLAEKFSCSAMFSKKEFAVISNLRFISRTKFMLNWVEHEKSFITLWPDQNLRKQRSLISQFRAALLGNALLAKALYRRSSVTVSIDENAQIRLRGKHKLIWAFALCICYCPRSQRLED